MTESFGMRSLHPFVIVLYFAGGIAFGMLLFHPIVLLTGLLATLAVNFSLDGGREWRRWYWPMLIGAVLVVLLNPLISHRGRTVLAYIGDMPLTLESVVYGITLALALLQVFTLFVAYRLVMSEQKFLFVFARFSPKAALVTMMAAGLVPRLRRRLLELMRMQRARGISVREGPVAVRAGNAAKLTLMLLSWTLEDALQTADSMQGRGYGTARIRSSYAGYRWHTRDGVAAAGLVLAAAAVVAAWSMGHGYLAIYPRLAALELTLGDILAMMVYILFIVLPLAWEWRDRKAWSALSCNK